MHLISFVQTRRWDANPTSETRLPKFNLKVWRNLYHIDVLQIKTVNDARLLQAYVHVFLIVTGNITLTMLPIIIMILKCCIQLK
jgi:hypothetical protein